MNFKKLLFVGSIIFSVLPTLRALENVITADFSSAPVGPGVAEVTVDGPPEVRLSATEGRVGIVEEGAERFARITWGPSPSEGAGEIPAPSDISIQIPQGAIYESEKLRVTMTVRGSSQDAAVYSWISFGPFEDRSEMFLFRACTLARLVDEDFSRNFLTFDSGKTGVLPERVEKLIDTGVEMLAGAWYDISFEFVPTAMPGLFTQKVTISEGENILGERTSEVEIAGSNSGQPLDLAALSQITLGVREAGYDLPELILDVKRISVDVE